MSVGGACPARSFSVFPWRSSTRRTEQKQRCPTKPASRVNHLSVRGSGSGASLDRANALPLETRSVPGGQCCSVQTDSSSGVVFEAQDRKAQQILTLVKNLCQDRSGVFGSRMFMQMNREQSLLPFTHNQSRGAERSDSPTGFKGLFLPGSLDWLVTQRSSRSTLALTGPHSHEFTLGSSDF